MLGNGLRSQTMRTVGFVLGAVGGLVGGGLALTGLALTSAASDQTGYVVAVLAGTMVVLGWTLVPLLFFGVDETLDPARFALLPIRRGVLARGMLAAAFVGVPPVVTLVATMGLVIAAGLRFGPVAAAAALVGTVAGLSLGIVASRALTSAFAALLRSRRMRDLAAVLMSLLATSIAPLQWTISAAAGSGSMAQAAGVARVLAWTPFGAAYALPYDVAIGRWDLACARVAIVLGSVVLLLWWWAHTLESAMYASSSGGTARSGAGSGGAVADLMPGWLRPLVRPGPYGAILARELRLWWRDGRRRAGLVSIVVASLVLPVAISFSGRGGGTPGVSRGALAITGFIIGAAMAGAMAGVLLCNQFAYDGSAFASHLLSRVKGALDLRARATALALLVLPAQVLVVTAVCVVTGARSYLPLGLGVLAATVGVGLGVAAIVSVIAPFALPQNANPFATNSGGGSVKGLLGLLALAVTLLLSAPVAIGAILLHSAGSAWLILVVGAAYGLLAHRLATYIAGDVLDHRGPQVLAAVMPRRG
jgi:ABC-2 type transport system permease protein